MVVVFKTDVAEIYQANRLIEKLLEHFPESRINIDLEDCDKALRIQSNNEIIDPLKIKSLAKTINCNVEDLV